MLELTGMVSSGSDAALGQQVYAARDHHRLLLASADLLQQFHTAGPGVVRTLLLSWLASWRSSVADLVRDYSPQLRDAEVFRCDAFLGEWLMV